MLDPAVTERIRSIFLQDEAYVTIEAAGRLLGMSGEELAAAVEGGDLETVRGCRGPMVEVRELAEQAVHVWAIDEIEEALGREAALVLPAGVRTRRFAARLPRYLVAALQCLAEENGESVDALLTRELHGLAYPHRERLGAAIAGFTEAVNWPFQEDAQQG